MDALLADLAQVYKGKDRDRIILLEKALSLLDKDALIAWKLNRIRSMLPFGPYLIWVGIGAVIAVIAGGVSIALAKLIRSARAARHICSLIIIVTMLSLSAFAGPAAVAQASAVPNGWTVMVGTDKAAGTGKDADAHRLRQLIEDLDKYSGYNWEQNTAESLSRIGGQAVEPLINVLENNNKATARSVAARALGRIGDPRAVDPLIAALQDTDWVVGQCAAQVLGRSKTPVQSSLSLRLC